MADDLLPLVNPTGFPLQLAIEEAVRLGGLNGAHAWTITSREHGWRDGVVPKFIDLVLTRGSIHLGIECKRLLKDDGEAPEWVFLVPDPPEGRRAEPRRWFRAQHGRDEPTNAPGVQMVTVAGLYNFQVDPRSWESEFCVVRGASDKDRPMLDRIAAELTRGTDALLDQQLQACGYLDRSRPFTLGMRGAFVTIPVIVTTARLYVCRFDPASVPLATGLLPKGVSEWIEVPFVRYRKSFDASVGGGTTLRQIHRLSERTIVVVNSTHLVSWLGQFDLAVATSQDLP